MCLGGSGHQGHFGPLLNPPSSRAAAGASGGRGRSPRTRARAAQRRSVVVAARLARADHVTFDQPAEALPLPNARERACEAVSGVRELSPDLPRVRIEDRAAYGGSAGRRLDPPQAGPEAFPQGSVAP